MENQQLLDSIKSFIGSIDGSLIRTAAVYPSGRYVYVNNLEKIVNTAPQFLLFHHRGNSQGMVTALYNAYFLNSGGGTLSRNGWTLLYKKVEHFTEHWRAEFESPLGELFFYELKETNIIDRHSIEFMEWVIRMRIAMVKKLEELANFRSSLEYDNYHRLLEIENRLSAIEKRQQAIEKNTQ